MGKCANESHSYGKKRFKFKCKSVANFKFGIMNDFKYLRANINNKNNMHYEINERIINGNRYTLV